MPRTGLRPRNRAGRVRNPNLLRTSSRTSNSRRQFSQEYIFGLPRNLSRPPRFYRRPPPRVTDRESMRNRCLLWTLGFHRPHLWFTCLGREGGFQFEVERGFGNVPGEPDLFRTSMSEEWLFYSTTLM